MTINNMQQPLVHIEHLNAGYPGKRVLNGLCWTTGRDEQWLLCGKSGSGKTTLGKTIAGMLSQSPSVHIHFDKASALPPMCLYVAQWFRFNNHEGLKNFYYQQRYNSFDSADAGTVRRELSGFLAKYGLEYKPARVFEALDMLHLEEEPLIRLSSGEHKKLQLAKALLLRPQLLILDNPYTGLDKSSRSGLNELLDQLAATGVQIILISNDGVIPACINRYAVLHNGSIEISDSLPCTAPEDPFSEKPIPSFLQVSREDAPQTLLSIDEATVTYNGKTILDRVSWTVNKGDRWLLQGRNGSGKSTLLSLVTGDNPQAYANAISLFGRQRGSGESIWDIKKHIGLISPELHWYFDPQATVFQTVASGLFDTIGLFRQPGAGQQARVNELLGFTGLDDERSALLSTLPMGKQRLCLLARALVKNPALLVLDEPCQGMDQEQTRTFNRLVDRLCTDHTTLIYVGHFESRLPACLTHRLVLEQGKSIINETLTETAIA